jgi:DNA-binding protein H-NS
VFAVKPLKINGRSNSNVTSEVTKMEPKHLEAMSVDQLWNLHEALVAELSRKIAAEKATLEQRLRKLGVVASFGRADRRRRPYPKVLPKFRNPKNPVETWAGRGKQPRWLRAQLRSGKRLDDFRIKNVAG